MPALTDNSRGQRLAIVLEGAGAPSARQRRGDSEQPVQVVRGCVSWELRALIGVLGRRGRRGSLLGCDLDRLPEPTAAGDSRADRVDPRPAQAR